jgi:hypothetical protein
VVVVSFATAAAVTGVVAVTIASDAAVSEEATIATIVAVINAVRVSISNKLS